MASMSANSGHDRGTRAWPSLATAAIVAAALVILRLEGRRWWCACGRPWVWSSDIWSSHCSQHPFDPYSLTHFSHGLILYWALAWCWGTRRWSQGWRVCAAVALAAAWEVIENSAVVIERYRSATMSLDYLGDSVVNSAGDIASCTLGYIVARRIGWAWTLGLFVLIELVLLAWIRDNLTLNVLMLTWPVRAVRDWQSVGHAPPG